uniref:Uncharacterized protein n=2 Tax=Kalmanozyma brasiliensis (strain GHG001) TaxID=1365824 RepID=V5EAA3_KALBG
MFGTPAKTRTSLVIPNTAPPKQVSFSLYANSFTGRLSPVKQMRMMPPLDTMNEEQDGSFHSENNESFRKDDAMEEQADSSDSQQDESSEDLVIVEELEQEQEPLEAEIVQSEPQPAEEVESAANEVVNTKNVQPATPSSSSASDASPSKSGSPKRAKRRSSFFGRAGPFAGINLGFYAEERTESKEPAKEVEQVEEPNEEFSDASDVEQAQMEDETPAPQAASSPVARRVVSRAIGMSKTPSPVKHQHFAGLTPLARRPRLSLASRRKVSLRTQTLLRSSEAYADRLFLPPPPSTPNGPSSLSKSMSMPSDLSDFSSDELEPASEQLDANDFDAERDPAMGKEAEEEAWKDSEDDEDEVDQSLSAISPSPLPAHLFSPVKASTLPKFATPQPASRTHSRRISMPPAGAADVKPSIRSTLIRLQISGAGERIVHQAPRMEEAASAEVARADRTSPSKARKVVRVSDVGLPATELSMGFDLVQDGAAEHDSNNIAGALNDLFTAEQEELTDDEDEEEYEEQEEIVQISSKIQESPARKTTSVAAPSQAPQTPAALNSVRHLFSAAAVAAPATPDMHGLGSMLDASPSKTPRYGSLGDRMRSSPEGSELLSPSKSSPRKKAILGSSPEKARRGVRRSQAAEVAVPAVRADAPAAVPDQTSETATEQPAFEAELHVTMLDASAMDAQNEAIAQAFAATEEHAVDAEEVLEDFAATSIIEDVILEEPAGEEELADEETAQVDASPVDDPIEEAVAEPAVPAARAPVAVEERAEEVSPVEQPATVEPSPSKTRASRRAASASPVKRTARSASPTKRALRSSPVKRGAASEVFAEETVQEAVQEPEAPVLEAQPEEAAAEPEAAAELEVSSPAKPARKTGGRKAKQAATEALVTSTPAPSSPEKPAPTKRGRAAKKAEAEQTHDEEERSEHEEAIEVAEEAPKRATRARATRAKPAAKPARTTRARAVKATEPALPSSSAGYGDDEASEEDVPAAPVKTKRATASRAKTTKTAKAAAAVEASEAEEHSADEPEAVKAKAPARTTRTKASTTKSKSKASAAESEDTTSSATTGTTTRSGRTTRRTAK